MKIKEHKVYKITEKRPQHGQLVLVLKEGEDPLVTLPFAAQYVCWLGQPRYCVDGKLITIDKKDKWIAITKSLFK